MKDRKRQLVMIFLPYEKMLNFGEFCPFTCQNLDTITQEQLEIFKRMFSYSYSITLNVWSFVKIMNIQVYLGRGGPKKGLIFC